MKRCAIFAVAGLLALCGCAVDRYQRNLTAAYVTPWTHLSPADHEAIVRLITDIDERPLIGISAHDEQKKDGSTISVYTGQRDQTTYHFWHGYDLKKEHGKWRVVFHGDCSPIIANFDLWGEMRRIQHERKRRKA
jgi:hypothetical protein